MRWKERSNSRNLSSRLHSSTVARVFALPTKEHVKKYVKSLKRWLELRVLGTKPYDLNLIIQTHTMEKEQTLASCPLFSTCVSYHTYMHT